MFGYFFQLIRPSPSIKQFTSLLSNYQPKSSFSQTNIFPPYLLTLPRSLPFSPCTPCLRGEKNYQSGAQPRSLLTSPIWPAWRNSCCEHQISESYFFVNSRWGL